MKKQSALIRRAALFTAIVVFAAIAVGLPAGILTGGALASRAAQDSVMSQARAIAQCAGDASTLAGAITLFDGQGGRVWLVDASGTRCALGSDPLPEAAATLTARALDGFENLTTLQAGGRKYACAVIPAALDGAVIAMLPISNLPALLGGMTGALCGALAALLAGVVLQPRMLMSVVRPLGKLRDVAVAVAEGNLDARASERAPGEIGELGKALNNVSTQLSRSMYSLILERNRLKHMLNGLSEGIVAIDREGHVTHTNPALERLFAKGKPVPHLPDPRMKFIPDKTIWEDFDHVIATGEPLTRNLDVRDMTLRLSITPTVDELGAIVGAVGLLSDITQMERLERTRREYVSNVSHELRTPLTAMRALVEPLKEGMVTSEVDRQRYYDIILREVMRLSRLINDQLELSRLQSGTVAIQKSRMTLDDLVYDVCDRYNAIAREHGLDLNILTDFSECPPVYANADRVEQMLIILLDNAIKYTEEGSVSVSASWDDEKVILSVRDTGVGIDDEDLPYVFDRFYKVDKAHSGKGSGLGLSIANELLRRMDEEIWVTSEKGKGSEFCFTVHRFKQ